jgi:hypothetical protein
MDAAAPLVDHLTVVQSAAAWAFPSLLCNVVRRNIPVRGKGLRDDRIRTTLRNNYPKSVTNGHKIGMTVRSWRRLTELSRAVGRPGSEPPDDASAFDAP